MTWIKHFFRQLLIKTKVSHWDSQQKLILLISIPSLSLITIALFSTDISRYLIAFVIICMLLLCSYAFVASKHQAEFQVRTLANLIESMIDGDYTLRGRLKTNQAFQELLLLINSLSATLARHKIEAKESKVLLELIVEQMDAMVLATNENGYLVMANASANKLLLGNVDNIHALTLNSFALGQTISQANAGIIEFNHPQLSGEHFLFKESFLSEGHRHQLYLLTNAERLLMEKERSAWQSLLRVLSHEMNNSLAPIAAISETILHKLQKSDAELDRDSLLDGVNIINERADSLSAFIASYSQLSHLPKPNYITFNISVLLEGIALLFPLLTVNIAKSCHTAIVADKNQIEQVLINLFKNALDAMNACEEKVLSLACADEGKWQKIIITDQGTGIANFDNLFVPFYTTKKQGSGIGLALCRQIMFNHNGMIKLQNCVNSSGVEALLFFPKQESH
jgi:nitrogen fixation/metabolism regulation signal transduction histidine kinase